MSGLTALDAHFADGNVPLGVVLGAIGALSAVRRVLPNLADIAEERSCDDPPSSSVEPFVAMLLGVVALHDRLTTLVDGNPHLASDDPRHREVVPAHSLTGLAR
jgi:hypothetical protein